MEEYRIAQISGNTQEEITRLEHQIKDETQKEVVLVAYEPECRG